MATRRLAHSVTAQARPQTQTRTAKVIDVLEPVTREDGTAVGWQVLLDFGGAEISRAGVASSYNPVPGDTVVVARYLGSLFVIDRATAGDEGEPLGNQIGFVYYNSAVSADFVTAAANVEVNVTQLGMTVTLRNGAAYVYEIYSMMRTTIANVGLYAAVRFNGVGGVACFDLGRQPVTLANSGHPFYAKRHLRNDTGYDLTVTLMPTITGPPGGSGALFNSILPRPYAELTLAGSSKQYKHASPVPAPTEIT